MKKTIGVDFYRQLLLNSLEFEESGLKDISRSERWKLIDEYMSKEKTRQNYSLSDAPATYSLSEKALIAETCYKNIMEQFYSYTSYLFKLRSNPFFRPFCDPGDKRFEEARSMFELFLLAVDSPWRVFSNKIDYSERIAEYLGEINKDIKRLMFLKVASIVIWFNLLVILVGVFSSIL